MQGVNNVVNRPYKDLTLIITDQTLHYDEDSSHQ